VRRKKSEKCASCVRKEHTKNAGQGRAVLKIFLYFFFIFFLILININYLGFLNVI
jgi:hypothetical protein